MNELALFAGAGGGILGGKLHGRRTICAVERDAYAAQVLAQRQNDGILEAFPIWSDVTTFDGRPWRGLVDIISGGFPCQDISAAGAGAGIDGERSGLWSHMARIIREVRPRRVEVENSPMLTSRGLGRVLGDLATLGFDAEWGVISAADTGAPHLRERIWILADAGCGRCGRADCWEMEQPWRAKAIGGSEVMAYADSDTRNERRTRDASQRQGRRDVNRGSQRQTMADTEGQRCGEAREFRYGQPEEWACGSGEEIPTPQASDAKDRGNLSSPCVQRRMEIGKQVNLSMCVSSESGQLNPEWVEWLMGWPIGWTALKPLAMDKFQEWKRQHGEFWESEDRV